MDNGTVMKVEQQFLFFVRSGSIRYEGHAGWSGSDNCNWSSRANSNYEFWRSFFLLFTASGIHPSNNNSRYHGFPLRCLVR